MPRLVYQVSAPTFQPFIRIETPEGRHFFCPPSGPLATLGPGPLHSAAQQIFVKLNDKQEGKSQGNQHPASRDGVYCEP